MTKTQAINTIRSMGLVVRATGFASELRITYRLTDARLRSEDGYCGLAFLRSRAEAVAYYTDSPEDAVETAKMMAGRI